MDRSRRTLERNLHELGRAIFERRAIVGIEQAKSIKALGFFHLAHDALFNDMIAHAIKVLDNNKDSETFWSIYKREKAAIDQYLLDKNYSIDMLDNIAAKLKLIRNKTHFHIDKRGVLNPSDVWKKADIKGKDLAKAIDIVWEVLNYIYMIKIGNAFSFPDYDGSDVIKIIKISKKEGLA